MSVAEYVGSVLAIAFGFTLALVAHDLIGAFVYPFVVLSMA